MTSESALEDLPTNASGDLDQLTWDDRFVRSLPADSRTDGAVRQVIGAAYSRVAPTPVAEPRLLAWSPEVAELVGLSERAVHSARFASVVGGNELVDGMAPYAACYGGHQFGHWAGQLGDGRAITLGEVLAPSGRWELQLKGAGPTPYSRSADGRAVLRSSIREFICSEAMHHLGVPTTRALSLVGTGEPILRDMFYDGRAGHEPGAVVCRVAPSFLRFGSFELPAARRDVDLLRVLVEDTIATWFAELGDPTAKDTVVAWVAEVGRRTAELIADWQRVGFVHGVMNTDNLSILGLTIDYGPYGWLEGYDPDWTPNTTDAGGRRYRFGHQPQIGMWNLARLAEAVIPLVGEVAPLEEAVGAYRATYQAAWSAIVRAKLGLAEARADDQPLLEGLELAMRVVETDMTLFFRGLAALTLDGTDLGQLSDEILVAPLRPAIYQPAELTEEGVASLAGWLRAYGQRVQSEGRPDAIRRAEMNAVNPLFVPRNYLAQLAIERAEQGDPTGISELLDVLRHPYDEQPGRERFAEKRPEWARHKPGCSMLSCSS